MVREVSYPSRAFVLTESCRNPSCRGSVGIYQFTRSRVLDVANGTNSECMCCALQHFRLNVFAGDLDYNGPGEKLEISLTETVEILLENPLRRVVEYMQAAVGSGVELVRRSVFSS